VKEFKCGDKELVCNSCLKLFAGKLKSKWSGPYTIKEVFTYGAMEIENEKEETWKVNGRRLKTYIGGPTNSIEEEEELLEHTKTK